MTSNYHAGNALDLGHTADNTTLDLDTYHNGEATFRDQIAISATRPTDRVTVTLSARTWHDMGRPSRIRIAYTINSAH